MPIFVYFIIATIGAVILNVFPPTSIIILFLMGPFWPGLFANLAVVSMAFEAAFGFIPRHFLLGPFIWFGFGVLGHVDSRNLAHNLDQDTAAFNMLARERLGQAGRSLTLIQNGKSGGLGPSQFLRSYDVDRVYELNINAPSNAWSIVSRPYGSPTSETGFGNVSARYFGIVEDRDLLSGVSEKREETSTVPRATTVELFGEKRVNRRGLVGTVREYRLISNRQNALVRSGSVTGPGWFLFPVVGCFPNGGTSACEGWWSTERSYSLGRAGANGGDSDVIAEALGLKRSSIRERFPEVRTCGEIRIESIRRGTRRTC